MIDVISLKDAKKLVFDNLLNLEEEKISILDCLGRVISEDILSKENLPQFKRSTVDGYAVKSINTTGVSASIPGIFKLVSTSVMGVETKEDINDYEAIYVPTGGMVPDGADAVVMIENTKNINNEVLVFTPTKKNENIINIGDDIEDNELVLSNGTILNAFNIGLLAGLGISSVKVYKKFLYSIISTGDEIIKIDEPLDTCKIRDINTYSVCSYLDKYGICINKILVKDDKNELEKAIKECFEVSSYIFISGGSSVGKKDYTLEVIDNCSDKVLFHGISIKPGKPTMASIKDETMIIGLPGHPMAALMSLDLVFVSALKEKMNMKYDDVVYAKTKINFPSSPGRTTIMPLRLFNENNQLYAEPLFYKSGMISVLNKANGYMIIDELEEGINKDSIVEVRKIWEKPILKIMI